MRHINAIEVQRPSAGVTYRGYLGATSGVSDSWMADEQLRETQALLRMAANAGRLGAWAVALPAMDWTWSEAVKAIHEVPADFMPTTEAALAFYEPHSRELAITAFEECARNGTPFDLELQLISSGGRLLWIRAIGEAERDVHGAITGMRGAIQDISKAKAVSDEARRVAQRFTRTLEMLTDGFILLDHEWRFVYLNPEAERILRRGRSSLIGRSLLLEFPETAAGSFLEKCMDASQAGNTVEFTKFYPPLAIWVHFKVWPSDQGLTFCIRDDTERIAARREILRLRAQLDARA
jgi:PAS domain-containing protein